MGAGHYYSGGIIMISEIVKLKIENSLGLNVRLDRDFMGAFDSIRRLARKHHRLMEMSCNGVGYVNGHTYYCGKIDEWARRQYGAGVRSSYVTPEDADQGLDIFDSESSKIEDKIKKIAAALKGFALIEFQGDPRGATVKMTYGGKDITDLLWE